MTILEEASSLKGKMLMHFLRNLVNIQKINHVLKIMARGTSIHTDFNPMRQSSMRLALRTDVIQLKWYQCQALLDVKLNQRPIDFSSKNHHRSLLEAVLDRADAQLQINRFQIAKTLPFDEEAPHNADSLSMARYVAHQILGTGFIHDLRDTLGYGYVRFYGPSIRLDVHFFEGETLPAISLNTLRVFSTSQDIDHITTAIAKRIQNDKNAEVALSDRGILRAA